MRTYTLVTTGANAEMSTQHDPMPLVLEREAWPAWLGEEVAGSTELLRPAPDDILRMWAVSRAVNSVRDNGLELVDRIDDPAAPPASNAPTGENPSESDNLVRPIGLNAQPVWSERLAHLV